MATETKTGVSRSFLRSSDRVADTGCLLGGPQSIRWSRVLRQAPTSVRRPAFPYRRGVPGAAGTRAGAWRLRPCGPPVPWRSPPGPRRGRSARGRPWSSPDTETGAPDRRGQRLLRLVPPLADLRPYADDLHRDVADGEALGPYDPRGLGQQRHAGGAGPLGAAGAEVRAEVADAGGREQRVAGGVRRRHRRRCGRPGRTPRPAQSRPAHHSSRPGSKACTSVPIPTSGMPGRPRRPGPRTRPRRRPARPAQT